MRPKAKWAINSEPIRARGIIVNKKFYHFDIGGGLTSFSVNNCTNFFGEKKSKMKLSGMSFFGEHAQKLKV